MNSRSGDFSKIAIAARLVTLPVGLDDVEVVDGVAEFKLETLFFEGADEPFGAVDGWGCSDFCQRVGVASSASTLTNRNNLASSYQQAGRTNEAIALHELALAQQVEVLGDSHPHTLTNRNNLASSYQWAGRTNEAIALHELVLAQRVETLGECHSDTVTSRWILDEACCPMSGNMAKYRSIRHVC